MNDSPLGLTSRFSLKNKSTENRLINLRIGFSKLEKKMKISKIFFVLTAVAAQNDPRDERLKREAKEFNSEKEAKVYNNEIN